VSYLGASPTVGLVTKLSNIASGFNGSTTTFQLSIPPGGASNNFTPGSTYALFVRLGGVTQNPDVDYTVSGSQITFTTAPASGLTCFIIAIGQAINIGVPNDGSVGQSKLGTITSLPLTGATSGTTTIAPPAVAGNNTITLPASNGSAYQVLRNGATAGTTEFGGAIVSGTAVASTSGTSIDFTGIPSWVKRVTVMFSGVSTSGTSRVQIQLGTSSGFETSSYLGSIQTSTLTSNFSAGFLTTDNASGTAAYVRHGLICISALGSNAWVASINMGLSNQGDTWCGSGSKTLSGTLDRVRITTVNGTDTFDAGTINILYE
jgi:hypothetical protein